MGESGTFLFADLAGFPAPMKAHDDEEAADLAAVDPEHCAWSLRHACVDYVLGSLGCVHAFAEHAERFVEAASDGDDAA